MAAFNSSLPTLGRTDGMFRQELFSTFGDLQTVRLCNSANPGGDRGDDVYVCGCLANAGKVLGGSRTQQLWV